MYLCWASLRSQAPTPDKNFLEFEMVMGEPENSSVSEESSEGHMLLNHVLLKFVDPASS